MFDRLGSKNDRIARALEYCRVNAVAADVVAILEAAYIPDGRSECDSPSAERRVSFGFVYLARGHPGEFKLGRTNLVDRRLAELGAMSPTELTLSHAIKTDDPAGVEAYWHQRFAEKRRCEASGSGSRPPMLLHSGAGGAFSRERPPRPHPPGSPSHVLRGKRDRSEQLERLSAAAA